MEQHDIPLPPVVSPDVCLYETDEALLYSAFMPGVPQDEARVIFRKATMEFEFGVVWVPMPDEPQFRQVYSGNIKMHQGPFSVTKTVHLVRRGRIYLKVPKEYEDLLALPEEFEIQTEPREPEELPKASKYQLKGPQNLDQLDRMFKDVAATGVAAWTRSSNTLPRTMLSEGVGDSDGTSEFKDNQCDMSLDIDSLQQGHTSQSRSSGQKRTSESIHSQKKKKKIREAAMLDERISELIKVCQNKSASTSRECPSSVDNVMKIVKAIPGVDSAFVVEASIVLMKKSHREMFLTFKDPESQLQWLQVMIRNQKK